MPLEQAPGRCPRCAGAVRPGAPWCTQCHLPLEGRGHAAQHPAAQAPGGGPGQVAPAGQHPAPTPYEGAGQAVQAALHRPVLSDLPGPVTPPDPAGPPEHGGGWPCSACGRDNPWEAALCAGCGTPFLGGAGAELPRVALPGVGDLSRLGRGQRAALVTAVLLLGVVLLVLLSAVGGALLPGG